MHCFCFCTASAMLLQSVCTLPAMHMQCFSYAAAMLQQCFCRRCGLLQQCSCTVSAMGQQCFSNGFAIHQRSLHDGTTNILHVHVPAAIYGVIRLGVRLGINYGGWYSAAAAAVVAPRQRQGEADTSDSLAASKVAAYAHPAAGFSCCCGWWRRIYPSISCSCSEHGVVQLTITDQ